MEPSDAGASGGSGPPNRRTMSAAQISRKRQLDRAKKRTNRAEYKNRLEAIERDVSFMCETIGELIGHLRQHNPHIPPRTLGGGTPSAPDSSGRRSPSGHDSPGSSSSVTDSPGSVSPMDGEEVPDIPTLDSIPRKPSLVSSQGSHGAAWGQLPHHLASHAHALPSTSEYPHSTQGAPASTHGVAHPTMSWDFDAEETQAANSSNLYQFAESTLSNNIQIQPYTGYAHSFLPGSGGAGLWTRPQYLECRCGLPHRSSDQCTDQIFFRLVFHSDSRTALPRNPSLRRLLRQSSIDKDKEAANGLFTALDAVLTQYQFHDFATMIGTFFLAYRFGRWHLHPTAEVYADIPGSMRPTESQKLFPHPFFFNSVPWPRLREALCSQLGQDRHHSLSLYIPSLRFNWPKDRQLVLRDTQGMPALHPEFESIVGDMRYWSMSSPWTDLFPDLVHFLGA